MILLECPSPAKYLNKTKVDNIVTEKLSVSDNFEIDNIIEIINEMNDNSEILEELSRYMFIVMLKNETCK